MYRHRGNSNQKTQRPSKSNATQARKVAQAMRAHLRAGNQPTFADYGIDDLAMIQMILEELGEDVHHDQVAPF